MHGKREKRQTPKSAHDIIDSSPAAIRSTASYFKVMQKRNFGIRSQNVLLLRVYPYFFLVFWTNDPNCGEMREEKKPVNLVILVLSVH